MTLHQMFDDNLSKDTKKCVRKLNQQSEAGHVKGVAFIAYVQDHGFIANAAGAALEDIDETRRMLRVLDRKLAKGNA